MTTPKLPLLPSPHAFSSELIKARTEHGLTQAQLSTKSGLSLSAIKAYEAGRNMPGARELRELCQALTISPNKLLFGTETPFKEQSFADLLVDTETEDDHVARARATILLGLLSSDERHALLTLARALSIARHGQDKVKEALTAADVFAGIGREFSQLTRDALVTGKGIDDSAVEQSGKRFSEYLDRQGHKPKPEKLPKK